MQHCVILCKLNDTNTSTPMGKLKIRSSRVCCGLPRHKYTKRVLNDMKKNQQNKNKVKLEKETSKLLNQTYRDLNDTKLKSHD